MKPGQLHPHAGAASCHSRPDECSSAGLGGGRSESRIPILRGGPGTWTSWSLLMAASSPSSPAPTAPDSRARPANVQVSERKEALAMDSASARHVHGDERPIGVAGRSVVT